MSYTNVGVPDNPKDSSRPYVMEEPCDSCGFSASCAGVALVDGLAHSQSVSLGTSAEPAYTATTECRPPVNKVAVDEDDNNLASLDHSSSNVLSSLTQKQDSEEVSDKFNIGFPEKHSCSLYCTRNVSEAHTSSSSSAQFNTEVYRAADASSRTALAEQSGTVRGDNGALWLMDGMQEHSTTTEEGLSLEPSEGNISADSNVIKFEKTFLSDIHSTSAQDRCTNETDDSEDRFTAGATMLASNCQRAVLKSLVELLDALSIESNLALARRQSFDEVEAQLEVRLGHPVYGRHLLHHAVASRDYATLALLLKSRHRDTINELDQLGRTPLHLALLSADVVAVQLLLGLPVLPSISDTLVEDDEYIASSEDDNLARLDVVDDVDFPDLGISFGELPVIHLPLAAAVVPSNPFSSNAVLETCTLLLGYVDLARGILRERIDRRTAVALSTFVEACGWAPRYEEAPEVTTEGSLAPCHRRGLERFADFLDTRCYGTDADDQQILWSVDAADEQGSTALHRACSLGKASIVELLLDAGANPLCKDMNGNLPVHRAIDSGDEETFVLLLRRGGAVVEDGDAFGTSSRRYRDESGCNPWDEDTSIVALFKHCIMRGAWRCLGRLVTDSVYSQFPISETDFDLLVDFAQLCGFHEEFSEAFKMAVDGSIPTTDGICQQKGAPVGLKIFTHDACFNHIPLPENGDLTVMKRFKLFFKYPENPSRLHCLVSDTSGILHSAPFQRVQWETDPSPVTLADILRVHDWNYINSILSTFRKQFTFKSLNGEPQGSISPVSPASGALNTSPPLPKNTGLIELDADTALTLGSWDAACRAAGAAIAAVNAVCSGEARAAFCAVRPPGHHVGTFGPCQPPATEGVSEDAWPSPEMLSEEDWLHGSQGFCLLNNVAIAASYARYRYADRGIRRIAIVDFDIHHGNGTEQIVMNLKPRLRKLMFLPRKKTLDVNLELTYSTHYWKPWLDETDSDEVFFASIHGFGERFYPNTGGQELRSQHPNIRNVPLPPRVNREEFRTAFKERLLAPLAEFHPDLLLISAGFDGHSHDLVNDTFAPCSEWDFEWLTRLLVAVANDCCNGRIVSVLEGGYNSKAGALSPLAQSVAHHVLALVQTPPSLSLHAAKLLDDRCMSQAVDRRELVEQLHPSTTDNPQAFRRRRKRAAAVRALALLSEQSGAVSQDPQGKHHCAAPSPELLLQQPEDLLSSSAELPLETSTSPTQCVSEHHTLGASP